MAITCGIEDITTSSSIPNFSKVKEDVVSHFVSVHDVGSELLNNNLFVDNQPNFITFVPRNIVE